MFGSVVIDVVIGLTLVYLLLSLVSSAIREGLASIFKSRARFLHRGVSELLGDPTLVADLYKHPLVSALYRGPYDEARQKHDLPSYIPSRNFALALLDMAARGRDARNPLTATAEASRLSLDAVRRQVWLLRNEPVQRVILSAIDTASDDLTTALENVQDWFDASMERVSGWYKRRTQLVLFIVGLATTIACDADTVRIANQLYRDPARRDAAVAMAAAVGRDTALARTLGAGTAQGAARPSTASDSVPSRTADVARGAVARLDSLGLPLAWADVHAARDIPGHIAAAVLGWLLTAFAISLGAPFWFEMLNRVMAIRSTVKARESAPQDERQRPAARATDGRVPVGGTTVVVATPQTARDRAGAARPIIPAEVAILPPSDPSFKPQEWESGHPEGGVL
jgi:hypothetical protein